MESELTSLTGMASDASIDDLKDQREEVGNAWDDVVSAAEDVEDAEVGQLQEAVDALRDAVDDIGDDESIGDALASLQDEVQAVQTAWTDLRTATNCS
jgi:hypothetical protein